MTALEKFNEIKGLEKLKEDYPWAEFKLEEQTESVLLIIDEDHIYSDHPITFECYYEEPPFITIYWNYDSSDNFDGRVSRNNAENIAYELKELEEILGLED